MKREDLAGPALIAGSVLLVLHQFAFGGRLSSQHPDVLGFWLPTYCFLGKGLAAGHVPAWNPHVMAGVPFAADPQSGWMYLPPMALFTVLSCGAAMRWMIVLQPILGGLALYGFLRSEGLSRSSATLGGLGLALPLASSRLGQFLPFPSALAWTAVSLWACSRYLQQGTWSRRLVWLVVVALAWGQLAAAYFAHGLVIGTGALGAYVAARWWRGRRDTEAPGVGSAALLLVPALIAVNLAFLLPRLAYLPRTSFAQAGAALSRSSGLSPVWPLKLAISPGAYLGAALIVLAFVAFRAQVHRYLLVAFLVYGAAFYVAGLDVVAGGLAAPLETVPVLRLYAHFPGRFGLALLLVFPIAGAIGLEAWREANGTRHLIIAFATAAVLAVGVPLLVGVSPGRFALLAMGATLSIPVLLLAIRHPRFLAVIPALTAVELAVNGLAGLSPSAPFGADFAAPSPTAPNADPLGARRAGWLVPVRGANVDPGAYLEAGPIARALARSRDGRYLSVAPEAASGRGYLTAQAPSEWPLLASQRSMLFGLQDVQGYNPVQLGRYWRFVRAISPERLDYNAAVLTRRPPFALDLLQVSFLIEPTAAGTTGGEPLATEGRWTLGRSAGAHPRASVLASWRVVSTDADALSFVTASGFDPSIQAVLERDPRLGPSPPPSGPRAGKAIYLQYGDQAAAVTVESRTPAIVLIRTPYDPNWHATVDGKPARVLPADYLVQGVPVPAGRHRIDLRYDDPWIGYGLLGSGVALGALLTAASVLRNRPVLAAGALTSARSER